MIKEQTYYRNKSGSTILVRQIGKFKAIVKVVKTNKARIMSPSTIAKSYHEITWQEALK